jgi:hypothetical protein
MLASKSCRWHGDAGPPRLTPAPKGRALPPTRAPEEPSDAPAPASRASGQARKARDAAPRRRRDARPPPARGGACSNVTAVMPARRRGSAPLASPSHATQPHPKEPRRPPRDPRCQPNPSEDIGGTTRGCRTSTRSQEPRARQACPRGSEHAWSSSAKARRSTSTRVRHPLPTATAGTRRQARSDPAPGRPDSQRGSSRRNRLSVRLLCRRVGGRVGRLDRGKTRRHLDRLNRDSPRRTRHRQSYDDTPGNRMKLCSHLYLQSRKEHRE